MFSDVVLGVELASFEAKLKEKKVKYGVKDDNQLSAEALKELVGEYKMIVKEAGKDFPVDPWQQLRLAIDAVFRSWNTPRAVTYRKINNIPESYGTAVSVVTMVFGNLGDDCGTGVCFTRSPSTGENRLFGEYLINAQGEDVVAGIRTPVEISQLATAMPDVYKEFCRIAKLLEEHYKDAQDIEFTVERGKLYILQTRNGKRTAAAAVKVAMDMYREGLIDERTAVERVAPEQVEQLLHPQIDPKAKVVPLVKGLPASPGAAAGYVVFDADEAAERGKNGEKVILVRPETTPDDIHGLFAAQGVVTAHGGMTSHAAVVARGLGKPCVSGAESIRINLAAENFTVGETTVNKNDFITIDGTKGEVILGEVKLMEPQFDEDFRELLKMADRISTLEVWANADTPEDARRARGFGAKGIGLCRTEHMFMAQDRLPVMQDMVVASTLEERLEALKKLEEMQEEDFYGIFDAMDGLPVTVRLLDPPLHEFLPKLPDLDKELKNLPEGSPEAEAVKITTARVHELHEANPMLGFRGCRLGIIYPEIYEMQVRAIFKAACRLVKEGKHPVPDIMIPLVATKEEMRILRVMVDSIAPVIMKEYGCQVEYMVGTMIELPRAAMVADQLAQHAQFFSFGTNDLTQTTFGYSRDDAEGKFLGQYVAEGILPQNPFGPDHGVGGLMEIGVAGGRKVNPSIQLEYAVNTEVNLRVAFCHKLGLNCVSCSPFRVPVSGLPRIPRLG